MKESSLKMKAAYSDKTLIKVKFTIEQATKAQKWGEEV
jgi:hypothetical protein